MSENKLERLGEKMKKVKNGIIKWLLLTLTLIGCLFGCSGMDINSVTNSVQPENTTAISSEQQTANEEQTDANADVTADENETIKEENKEETKEEKIKEDGIYDSKEEVALYLSTYQKLPDNYITKKEAKALGWPGGGLDDYAYGKCIGGDYFGNYEEKLPSKKGRSYYECDIDTLHADSRGAKRIVYSDDGLIYYTENHYETFVLLYGKE